MYIILFALKGILLQFNNPTALYFSHTKSYLKYLLFELIKLYPY